MRKSFTALISAGLLISLQACTQAPESSPPQGRSLLFLDPAEQIEAYKRMEDRADVATVPRGNSVRALPQAAGPEPDIAFTWKGEAMTIESYMEDFRVSGLLILKDGKIALERYALGRTPRDRWTSFSVAKSVTAILVGAAIKDGAIRSIDDPVVRYIPDLAGSAYESVTVGQLLTMTSGVKWNEDYGDPNSDVAKAGQTAYDGKTNPIVAYMKRLPREAEPGTKFVYKTGETDLAGILVSRATGKTLAEYASEKLWKPYGMEQDAIWVRDVAGHERGGCCMSMTLRDYARIGQFMLEGGAGVMSPEYVAAATSNQVANAADSPPDGYGYFWWITSSSYAAQGIFGQAIYVNPTENLIVAFNSAWPEADAGEFWAAQEAYIAAAAQELAAP